MSDIDDLADGGGSDGGRRRHLRWIGLAVAAPLIVVAGLVIGEALTDDDRGDSIAVESAAGEAEYDHEYVIPTGTGDRILAGEEIAIVPRELEVRVGETIRIVNNDIVGHDVGVFYIGAGQTLTQRFRSPGELESACTVHPSGAFTLRVVEP